MTLDTMQIGSGELAQMVGSRLCHDLISPLGAIGNGVELLEMSPDFPGISDSPELRLIAESVAAARARIQAFRIAFGQAQGDQRVSRAELARLAEGVSAQGRLKVQLDAQGDFARADVRMVMLALMCLETALPWGGRVMILHGSAGWRFVAEADRTKPDTALWALFDPGAEGSRACGPAEVHFALLADAARRVRRGIRWEVDEQGAEIAF